MKHLFLAIIALFFASSVFASEDMKFEVISEQGIKSGEEFKAIAKLTDSKTGKAVTFADLKEVHTKKFHLLIIDSAVADYAHVHPIATSTPGEYFFSFTPKSDYVHFAWADVTSNLGKHHVIKASIKGGDDSSLVAKKIENNFEVDQEGYKFMLSFDSPPSVGGASMAHLKIYSLSKQYEPVTTLEPVLGAFAHMVGFSGDLKNMVHIHPLGEEPKNDKARGGHELSFHIILPKDATEYYKLFAQFKIDGKDLFVPFVVKVAK